MKVNGATSLKGSSNFLHFGVCSNKGQHSHGLLLVGRENKVKLRTREVVQIHFTRL